MNINLKKLSVAFLLTSSSLTQMAYGMDDNNDKVISRKMGAYLKSDFQEEAKKVWGVTDVSQFPAPYLINDLNKRTFSNFLQTCNALIPEDCKTPEEKPKFLNALLSVVCAGGIFYNSFARLAETIEEIPSNVRFQYLLMTQDLMQYWEQHNENAVYCDDVLKGVGCLPVDKVLKKRIQAIKELMMKLNDSHNTVSLFSSVGKVPADEIFEKRITTVQNFYRILQWDLLGILDSMIEWPNDDMFDKRTQAITPFVKRGQLGFGCLPQGVKDWPNDSVFKKRVSAVEEFCKGLSDPLIIGRIMSAVGQFPEEHFDAYYETVKHFNPSGEDGWAIVRSVAAWPKDNMFDKRVSAGKELCANRSTEQTGRILWVIAQYTDGDKLDRGVKVTKELCSNKDAYRVIHTLNGVRQWPDDKVFDKRVNTAKEHGVEKMNLDQMIQFLDGIGTLRNDELFDERVSSLKTINLKECNFNSYSESISWVVFHLNEAQSPKKLTALWEKDVRELDEQMKTALTPNQKVILFPLVAAGGELKALWNSLGEHEKTTFLKDSCVDEGGTNELTTAFVIPPQKYPLAYQTLYNTHSKQAFLSIVQKEEGLESFLIEQLHSQDRAKAALYARFLRSHLSYKDKGSKLYQEMESAFERVDNKNGNEFPSHEAIEITSNTKIEDNQK